MASEGSNLHYQCHRMIHVDIPWSLMVFQQRNGRIDRYGQHHVPQILYLYTESQNEKCRGDTRILELLIERDEQATLNISDPSALQGVYDVDQQEAITATAMEEQKCVEEFAAEQDARPFNPLEAMLQAGQKARAEQAPRPTSRTHEPRSLFPSDYVYVEAALDLLRADTEVQFETDLPNSSSGCICPRT